MRISRQLVLVAVVAALAAASWWGIGLLGQTEARETPGPGGPGGGRPAPVELARAETGIVRRTVEAVGSTSASQSIDVVPVVSGRITRIAVEQGQRVEAGTLLFELDSLAQQAAIGEAQAALTNARQEQERAQALGRRGIAPEARVEEASAAVLVAEARLAAAEAELEHRRITAPFGGVVGLIGVSTGAFVQPGQALTGLDDLSSVEVAFGIPERFFAEVRPGMPVRATSVAFPGETFEGRVTGVGTRIDPESRSFAVEATLPNEDGRLPDGLFMGVSLVLETREDAVLVPEESLVVEGDRTFLFAVEGDRARRVEVRPGERRDGKVEVMDGLEAGASVVSQGQQRLGEGGPVEAVAAAEPEGGGGTAVR